MDNVVDICLHGDDVVFFKMKWTKHCGVRNVQGTLTKKKFSGSTAEHLLTKPLFCNPTIMRLPNYYEEVIILFVPIFVNF